MNCAGELRTTAVVFGTAVVSNHVWEMAQAPLYEPMGTIGQATWRCFEASLGDGLLVLVVLQTGALVFRSRAWFLHGSASRLMYASAVGLD